MLAFTVDHLILALQPSYAPATRFKHAWHYRHTQTEHVGRVSDRWSATMNGWTLTLGILRHITTGSIYSLHTYLLLQQESAPVCFQGGGVDLQSQCPKTRNIGQKYRLSDSPTPLSCPIANAPYRGHCFTLSLPVYIKQIAANAECVCTGHALDNRSKRIFLT